jgi:hypothetical protein
MGSDEFANNEVTVKDLLLGATLQDKKKTAKGKERDEWLQLSRKAQVKVPVGECIACVREILARPRLR